jgi:hypothetical protein
MISKKLIFELKDRLKLEHAQATDEYALALCAISGMSVFLVNPGLTGQLGNALTNVVRLLP